jgi:hypothetical protein
MSVEPRNRFANMIRQARIAWLEQLLIGETREARSQAKAPLDLIVWDAVASIELREAFLDFRKEHQTLNSIVDGSIWRQFANRLNHLFSGDAMWHTTLILLPAANSSAQLV